MWSVVIFTNDNCVAVVPVNWFKKRFCSWPKKSEKNRSQMIEKQYNPNSLQFNDFAARLLSKKPYESLQEAYRKAQKAQISSELSSEETPPAFESQMKLKKSDLRTKRKCPSPPVFDDSDDSDRDPNYTPQKNTIMPLKLLEDSPNYVTQNEEQIQKTESPLTQFAKFNSNTNKLKKKLFDVSPKHFACSSLSSESISETKEIAPTTLVANQINASTSVTDSCQNLSSKMETGESTNVSVLHSDLEETAAFRSFVKTSLTNIKYELKILSYSVDSIKAMCSQNLEINRTFPEHDETSNELPWPITNSEELDNIETTLIDQKIKNSEALKLSRLVGKNISETVRRIMIKMFDDAFLQNYSFQGFKGKNKFDGLNCCQLLFEAIRKDKRYLSIPDIDISSSLSKWLAQATNRQIKKKKKKKKTILQKQRMCLTSILLLLLC